MSETADLGRRKRRTMWWLTLLAVGMFGFGFAMVPLYGLLCNITGMQSVDGMSDLGRRMATAGVEGAGAEGRWVTVKFDTTMHPELPWSINPMEGKVRVRLGESRVVNFVAENHSAQSISGQAIPSIAPWQANGFFSKLECFCFSQQTLAGNERKEMPVRFVVSPDLPPEIDSLTLSYNVMRLQGGTLAAAQ
ncbi:MAG: cytochrome c oxidase assembly protein [Chromatiaceae bacterium]|jgi:cytochrome c oxidase assembly protein subunit 11|nr:cytochrome c oxidase assembly protein [Chromatiaceae bacterium]